MHVEGGSCRAPPGRMAATSSEACRARSSAGEGAQGMEDHDLRQKDLDLALAHGCSNGAF